MYSYLAGGKLDLEKGTRNLSPLQIASFWNRSNIVKHLLKIGANVNAKLNQTALHQACQQGHVEIVKILLDNGADVNIKSDENEKTPQDLALAMGHEHVVTLIDRSGLRLHNKRHLNIDMPTNDIPTKRRHFNKRQ